MNPCHSRHPSQNFDRRQNFMDPGRPGRPRQNFNSCRNFPHHPHHPCHPRIHAHTLFSKLSQKLFCFLFQVIKQDFRYFNFQYFAITRNSFSHAKIPENESILGQKKPKWLEYETFIIYCMSGLPTIRPKGVMSADHLLCKAKSQL